MAYMSIEVPDDFALRLESVKDRQLDILQAGYQAESLDYFMIRVKAHSRITTTDLDRNGFCPVHGVYSADAIK